MVIIVVACLGDLQLFITFTNIYRVKLEIACVRMSFENIYIYICIVCIYMHMHYVYYVYVFEIDFLFMFLSLLCRFWWVLTVRKEPFWCTFHWNSLLLLSFSIQTAKFASISLWFTSGFGICICATVGEIFIIYCALFFLYFALTSIIKLCSACRGRRRA